MALPFAQLVLPSVVLLIPLYLYIKYRRSKNSLFPADWPILGVLPFIAANRHCFHDTITSILAATNLNFRAYGPPGTNMRFFLTCDPDNVRHIFTKNFANYPKGDEFASVFGLLEGTIFTADGEAWRQQRARIHHVLTRPRLLGSTSRGCRDKVARGLIPLLSRMALAGTPFDIEDMLGRLVFDMTVMLVFGEDPCCLSTSKPPMPVATAMDALMEVAFFRHAVPTLCWKVMRRLRIGPERSVDAAEAVLRSFVAGEIRRRMAAGQQTDGEVAAVDILSHYIDDPDFFDDAGREPTDFLLKTFINFMVALRDPVGAALPWVLYNLATHPRVVSGVREELVPVVSRASSAAGMVVFEPEELKDLVYLRAALFESLRLFPSGPIERKAVIADDVLPSGHKVHAGETVLVPVYSMGRMESVWGGDCREYRPERWLSEDGARLRFVPSYKFLSFNTGPRSCLGKNIAMAQMMSVAAAVAWNFDVEVAEGHAVEQKLSVVLQMKNGLMVKVKKTGECV
ncbi:hypothetical protein GQ55_8G182600 [Panicum hallii var. hallii]|uniref:Cytochrome P450 n=1 Tax=Panicum hallii var. hallii TaxID=1504633 RepID=A0A2T7CNN7_9POAL|nr:hypothetical protein GQ55_8G182600 [Panicum hallii var. hallii]